jgi:uncharacterized protein YeaC (DUF1315 family)
MNEEFLAALNDDVIQSFRTAVEIGKWPDGRELTAEQRETCMQAIIVYENANLPENERTGYVPPKPTDCGDSDDEETVKWS